MKVAFTYNLRRTDSEEEAEFGKAVWTMDRAREGGAATIAVLTAPLGSGGI